MISHRKITSFIRAISIAGSIAVLLASSLTLTAFPAQAQQLGQACRSGQSETITTPVNIRVRLVCTKTAGVWRFANADGALHLTTYTVTVAQAGKPYRMFLPVLGGRPPYLCALGAGSGLPAGFSYAHAGQVLNGVWNCVIASGSVPQLNPGTTKLITPPFSMVVSDASTPIQHKSVNLQITILASEEPTPTPLATFTPPPAPTPTPTPAGPTLADLNGTYSATYTPSSQFDDVTVVGQPVPFTFTITNGQITGGATGQITWTSPVGNALVNVPLSFKNATSNCSNDDWRWTVDANHKVTLQAGLHCFGSYVYNDGTVTANKN